MAKEKFGAVDCGLWRHRKFKDLDDNCKLLFLYLKTCDHQNMIGCFHMPIGYITVDVKWSEKKVKETLCKLLENGFASHCKESEYVLLPKHLRKHPLQNANQGKGAASLFDQVPKEFIYIKDLARILLTQQTLEKPFANRLETLCNSVTVSVTVSDSVTEEVEQADLLENEPLENIFDNEVAFNDFWAMYPRKDDKKKAREKFLKLCDNVLTFGDIMSGLKNQIDFKWKDPKYIPMPTTWLNGERWTDQIQADAGDQALDEFINNGGEDE